MRNFISLLALTVAILASVAPKADAQQFAPANCSAQRFIVYFGFRETGLTSAARAVIHEAAAVAVRCPSLHVDVVTHMDTLEGNTPTPLLEYGRGSAVSMTLQGYGVGGARITETHRDIRELAVQTPANVQEQQNRTVYINLRG